MVGWRGRWARVVLTALLLAVVGVVAPVATAPARAAEPGRVQMSTQRDMVVEPSTNRTFVSYDDAVAVFGADGALLATLPGLYGAAGMDIAGSSLWVAETNVSRIAEIDLGTLTVKREINLAVPIGGMSLAVMGNALWFGSGAALQRYDLSTSTLSDRGAVGTMFEEVPGVPGVLLSYSPGGGLVSKIDTSTNPATVMATFAGGGTYDVALVAGSPTFATANANGVVREASIATMVSTGVDYPAHAAAVAMSPLLGGAVVAAGGSNLYMWKSGQPTAVLTATLVGTQQTRGLAVAPGGRVHALTRTFAGFGIDIVDPSPMIVGLVPTQLVAGVPRTLRVQGTNLLNASSVTLGGTSAVFKVVSSTTIEVTIPGGIGAGSRTLTVTTPLGSASTPVSFVANTGASLAGTVSGPSGPLAGVMLTLTASTLTTARTFTSTLAGGYSFAGLPYGTDYILRAHDPSGGFPDQTSTGFAVVPNEVTNLDVDLARRTPGSGATLSTTSLGLDRARDMVVDPATGRVYVSGDDEVDALDASGNLIGRVRGLPGAHGLALHNGDLYVNAPAAAIVARIDTDTLVVTRTYPVGRVGNGELVVAGGRAWIFGSLDTGPIVSIALGPGTITESSRWFYRAGLAPIDGTTNQFLLFSTQQGYTDTWVMSALWPTPAPIVNHGDLGGVVGSALLDRVWSTYGKEHRLSDLLPTGLVYGAASNGPDLFAPARGGVLAFGGNIYRHGVTTASHSIAGDHQAAALDAGADRFYVLDAGALVVWDLHPHVTEVVQDPVAAPGASLRVRGVGLGSTTSVEIDGTPRALVGSDYQSATVSMSGIAPGSHTVRVTTAWGPSNTFAFQLLAAPVITSVVPSWVPTAGGAVTVKGAHLAGTTKVTIGSVVVPFDVIDDATLVLALPAHPVATGPVVVTSAGGTNAVTPMFSWVAPLPLVTSVSPTFTPTLTPTPVTVKGKGFLYATKVTFDGIAVPFTVIDDQTITTTSPHHAPGSVVINVVTAGGTSAASPSATFTYQPAPPQLVSLNPNKVPSTGGSLMTLRGSRLTGAVQVTFGGVASPAFAVINDTTIVAIVPAVPAGVASIRVTTPFGSNDEITPMSYFSLATLPFVDVPAGAPFRTEIEWVAAQGITTGFVDGTFRPLGLIDRQAMAAFIYRFKGASVGADPQCLTAPFTDVPLTSPFCGEIGWLKAQGITTGNPDGTFRPNALVDRQAMAAFLYRAIGRPAGATPSCAVAPFTDVPVGAPFCGEIAWLKANGIAGGYPDGGFHPTDAVNRQATAAFLHRLSHLR